MRRGDYFLVDTPEDIVTSIFEFNSKPQFTKNVLGSSAIYFPFLKIDDKIVFGFSNFCGIKNITVEEYLKSARDHVNGSDSQKRISNVTGEAWQEKSHFAIDVSEAFDKWISVFISNYKVRNFQLLFIDINKANASISDEIQRFKRKVSPEELIKQLNRRKQIGDEGELFAYEFECTRLRKLGCKNPSDCVIHIAKANTAAGFDIISNYNNEIRYIEVKTTTTDVLDFYLTKNEYEEMQEKKKDYFLYLIKSKENKCELKQIIPNPHEWINENCTLETQLYKVNV